MFSTWDGKMTVAVRSTNSNKIGPLQYDIIYCKYEDDVPK